MKKASEHIYKGYMIERPEGSDYWNIRKIDSDGVVDWCFSVGYAYTYNEARATVRDLIAAEAYREEVTEEEAEEEAPASSDTVAAPEEEAPEADTVKTLHTTADRVKIGAPLVSDTPDAVEIPDRVRTAPDFATWRALRPPFDADTVARFAEVFGVYVSTSNSKTAIPSANFLAGSNAHNYDGITAGAGKEARGVICGACSGDCPGCYAKAMTRYTDTYIHDFDNTVAARVNPELYVAAVEYIALSGVFPPSAFRWHDSGDFAPSRDHEINRRYFAAVMECAKRHPFTAFGGYTKEAAIVYEYGIENIPENFCLSCSPWEGHCDPIGDLPQFIYDNGSTPELDTVPHCPAVDRFGRRTGVTCRQCGHCYHAKRGARRAVYAHDATGAKTLRENMIARGVYTAEEARAAVAEDKAKKAAAKEAKAAKKAKKAAKV